VGRRLPAGPRQGALEGRDRALPKFHRYLDKDDDAIPIARCPESRRRAPTSRAGRHNQYGGYTEDAKEYRWWLDRLARKFRRARTLVPAPVIEATGTSDIGLVAIGSSRGAVNEARDILAKRGISIDYMRIKAFPFTKEVEGFLASHDKIFVIEQNRDAQLGRCSRSRRTCRSRSCTRSCTTTACR